MHKYIFHQLYELLFLALSFHPSENFLETHFLDQLRKVHLSAAGSLLNRHFIFITLCIPCIRCVIHMIYIYIIYVYYFRHVYDTAQTWERNTPRHNGRRVNRPAAFHHCENLSQKHTESREHFGCTGRAQPEPESESIESNNIAGILTR